MRWVAHDGAPGRAPECLLASLDAAWTLGVELLVVDLVLTADDRVVVASPAVLERIGATRDPSAPSLADLRRLDPGRGFRGRFQTPAGVVQGADEPWIRHGNQPRWSLATLDELLAALGDRCPLVLCPCEPDDARRAQLLAHVEQHLARHRVTTPLGVLVPLGAAAAAIQACPSAQPLADLRGGFSPATLQQAEAAGLAAVVGLAELDAADASTLACSPADAGLALPGAGALIVLSGSDRPTTADDMRALSSTGRVWGVAPSDLLDPAVCPPPRPPLFEDGLVGSRLDRDHWVAAPSRRVPDTRWACSERGFEIDIVAGGSYSGAGLVLRWPIRGDFCADVDFELEQPVSAATLELCAINVNPGYFARTADDMAQEHPCFDVHGGSPYVGTERDEHDGFRAICSRGSTILTPGQQNVYNDYGRDVGDRDGKAGSLRLIRRGSCWSSWYRDHGNPDWMCCGSLVNESMNAEIWLRMAAKHWSKQGATPPASRSWFRNFSVSLR